MKKKLSIAINICFFILVFSVLDLFLENWIFPQVYDPTIPHGQFTLSEGLDRPQSQDLFNGFTRREIILGAQAGDVKMAGRASQLYSFEEQPTLFLWLSMVRQACLGDFEMRRRLVHCGSKYDDFCLQNRHVETVNFEEICAHKDDMLVLEGLEKFLIFKYNNSRKAQ